MSTLKATNLSHPSAASPNVVLGSTGSVAVAGALTGAGMDLINKTDFSAVSSVSLNNVFTSTYDNYVISWKVSSSTQGDLSMRFRTAGTDNTASNYTYSNGFVSGGTFGSAGFNNAGTTSYLFAYNGGSGGSSGQISVYSPFLADGTYTIHDWVYRLSSNEHVRSMGSSKYNAATSFDGFTMYPASSTITGTIRVYGYRNS